MGRQSAHVLDRVAKIAPILDRTAAESERLRTLCPETTGAMHAAGLFGMWVPREAGGLDIDLVTQVDAIVELARADMSACWTLMIGNTVTASMAATTTGMYSGLQPAITALIATFSAVTARFRTW